MYGNRFLNAKMVRPEEVHAPLPIDDVAHVLGEEAIDGPDVNDKVGRLGRGIPNAHIVEPDLIATWPRRSRSLSLTVSVCTPLS